MLINKSNDFLNDFSGFAVDIEVIWGYYKTR